MSGMIVSGCWHTPAITMRHPRGASIIVLLMRPGAPTHSKMMSGPLPAIFSTCGVIGSAESIPSVAPNRAAIFRRSSARSLTITWREPRNFAHSIVASPIGPVTLAQADRKALATQSVAEKEIPARTRVAAADIGKARDAIAGFPAVRGSFAGGDHLAGKFVAHDRAEGQRHDAGRPGHVQVGAADAAIFSLSGSVRAGRARGRRLLRQQAACPFPEKMGGAWR